MTDNPTQLENKPEPPDRIWINNPPKETEHDQRWWYDHSMAFPTVEYVRADLVSRAPVVAPQEDAATKARNRDKAQRIVLATEAVLGEQLNIVARHELTDRIAAALDAAPSPSSPVPPEQLYSTGFDDAARVSRVLNKVAATPTPAEQERDTFADLLPVSPRRIAPGEYEIEARNGTSLWYMDGAALAEWVCERINHATPSPSLAESKNAWSKWFDRLGDRASADVVNATADLVTDERLAALVQAGVLPKTDSVGEEGK